MTTTVRMAILLVVLLSAVLGFWWWGLNDYRETAATVALLKEDMETMKKHVEATERVLAALESLKVTVQNIRSESNAMLEDSRCYIGVDRLDKLERLLQDDLDRRGGNNASRRTARGLPGASGVREGVATP